jgi:hypothetical protein
MKKLLVVLFAISVFIVGAALIPFVGLPQEGFSWQRFADVYTPMSLGINYENGSPGSFFTVTGNNFPQDSTVTILANGEALGPVATDNDGDLFFIVDSGLAGPGFYIITTSVLGGPQTNFVLDLTAPLRPQEDTGTILVLPADIASQSIHLPVINK